MVSRKTLSVLSVLLVMIFVCVLVVLSMLGGVDNYTPTTNNPEVVFREACARCHGERGLGGSAIGPRLADAGESMEEVKRRLSEGHGRMPSFPNIRGQALQNLAAYVNGLSSRDSGTGRQGER